MGMNDEQTARVPIQFGDNLRITVAANQGGRRYMEDRCVVHTERNDNGVLEWTFVGVYDGHGGEHASEYVRRHLLMNITKNQKFESNSDEDILEAIRQGFLMTHEQMRHVYQEWPYTASGYPSTAGTTCSCVFIRNGKLYTGHVGDSAIYLGTVANGELRSCPLTIDHKPESAHEQIRIAKAGGETAVKSGVTRVVWKRPSRINQFQQARRESMNQPVIMDSIPFLSVARSLGDLWSYNERTNMFIVSPEPDLSVHRLTANDFCLVLASDGMTNVLTGDQSISIVFKEEELVEIHEEINRNHARCVLRSALQKWRSLRADNITVATVIFDIDPLSYTENEMLMKVGKYLNASQVLTDRPDAMLKISRTDNVLLTTQRTPIIYNGSRDDNYCRVQYRGPGFRTHDEELLEERRNIMSKFADGAIAIAGGSIDSKRGDIGANCVGVGVAGGSRGGPAIQQKRKSEKEEENVDYDDDEEDEDEEEDDGPFDPSEEISLKFTEKSVTMTTSPSRPPRPHAPRPVFLDDSIVEDSDEGIQSTSSSSSSATSSSSSITPSRTPPSQTVRRIKAEAVRRLRTPKITGGDGTAPSEAGFSPDRRVTRSASRAGTTLTTPIRQTGLTTPLMSPKSASAVAALLLKTPSPLRRGSIIRVNPNLTPDAILLSPIITPRRSTRLQLNSGGSMMNMMMMTPCGGAGGEGSTSSKLTMSRKRARTADEVVPMMTGVTPIVAGISLQEHYHPIFHLQQHHQHQQGPPLPAPHLQNLLSSSSRTVFPPPPTPSRSAPTTPKKSSQLKTSKWSLSQLDERKKQLNDGIVRVSEIADEEEDDDDEVDDVIRRPAGRGGPGDEPPSKIRRFYGYMKKVLWGK